MNEKSNGFGLCDSGRLHLAAPYCAYYSNILQGGDARHTANNAFDAEDGVSHREFVSEFWYGLSHDSKWAAKFDPGCSHFLKCGGVCWYTAEEVSGTDGDFS